MQRRRQKTPLMWVWEFSKKVVSTAFFLYIVAFVVTLLASYHSIELIADATPLNTFITEINETFRVVVGGYLIKAGGENIAKIVTDYQDNKKQQRKTR